MKSTAMAVAMAMTVCAVATGSEPIKMVDIPAGYFYMGSRALGENFDEGPVHKVTLPDAHERHRNHQCPV